MLRLNGGCKLHFFLQIIDILSEINYNKDRIIF